MLGLLCLALQSTALYEGKSKAEGKGRKKAVLQTKFLYPETFIKIPHGSASAWALGTR